MHPVFALFGFGEGGVNPVTGYRAGRIGADIAIDDFVIRAGGAPLFDEFGGKAARVGAMGAGVGSAGAGTAVDMKEGCHGAPLIVDDDLCSSVSICVTQYLTWIQVLIKIEYLSQ